MRPPLPPLDALEAFEAAARCESFARAGEELHLSASAVSHRIKVLEAHLGQRLFHRLPQGVRLTDRGRAFMPVVRDLFDELATETSSIFEKPAERRVSVRVPVSYGSLFLAPRLAAFAEQTRIEVSVLSVIWEGDMLDHAIDFEIRLSPPPRSGAEEIGTEVAVLVRHSAPSSPTGKLVRVLGYEDWAARLEAPDDLRPAPVAVDTWESAIALVAAHPGYCALIPSAIAAEPCRRGDVQPVEIDPVRMRSTYWLAVSDPPSMHRPAVFEFISWLRRQHAEFGPGS